MKLQRKTTLSTPVDVAGRFVPMAPARVGGGFSARQVAISVSCRSARPWWQKAGRIDVCTNVPKSKGGSLEVIAHSCFVPLGTPPLLIDLGASPLQISRLIFAPSRWLPEAIVEVWSST